MALLFPIAAALVLAVALGGRPGRLAELRLRAIWLFYAAVGLQVVAFPFTFLPWSTSDATAKTLWLLSYGLLLAAAVANRYITGVPLVALGMTLNLAAILANGFHMPVDPAAMSEAGHGYTVLNNSVADPDPRLGWLIDRWAAPDWVPLANVFSIGDVVIAMGSITIVLAATGTGLSRRAGRLPETPR